MNYEFIHTKKDCMNYSRNLLDNTIGHVLVKLAESENGIFHYIDSFKAGDSFSKALEFYLPEELYSLLMTNWTEDVSKKDIENAFFKALQQIEHFTNGDGPSFLEKTKQP